MKYVFSFAVVLSAGVSLWAAQGKVTRETVPGITNLARVETTVACAGAIRPESAAEIRKMGFTAIINLRLATENGANVEEEEAAAKAAGIRYAHIPFSTASPETAPVDRFLQVIVQNGYQPAFIHCAGGGRAAMMWFVKRVVVDKWDTDRAMAEAAQLGLTNDTLKKFAMGYIQKNKK